MEERSLDEFVEAGKTGSDSNGDDQTSPDSDGDDQTTPDSDSGSQTSPDSADNDVESPAPDDTARVPPGSVEPAAVTSRVVPGEIACEGCGEQVSRLWTSEDGERCRDCKEW